MLVSFFRNDFSYLRLHVKNHVLVTFTTFNSLLADYGNGIIGR